MLTAQCENLGILLLWFFGGLLAIRIITKREQRRLGSTFWQTFSESFESSPIPAGIGYLLYFGLSWVSVLYLTLTSNND
jgi:hypothetical protein